MPHSNLNERLALEFLLANVSHGFLERDAEGIIRRTNGRFVEIAATNADDIVGRKARDFVPGLRDEDADYESESMSALGEPRLVEVVTRSVVENDGSQLRYFDLLTVINPDRAFRDRLVAEVQKMSKLAQTDSLTGQSNRTEFEEALRALSEAEPAEPFGLAVVDLDEFKEINDRFGHAEGDAVLVEFAKRLRQAVRDSDVVARLGGDEFAVLLSRAPHDIAVTLIGRLRERLSFATNIRGEIVEVHASVGWAHSDEGFERIFEAADRRMYVEKRQRKQT